MADAPERLFVQLTAMGGTISYISSPPDNRRPVYEYTRVRTPADVQERARRAVQLLDDAGYLDEQFIADMAHNVGSDKQEFFEVCKQKMADIIAREFGGGGGEGRTT